jgi:hypothetical protein
MPGKKIFEAQKGAASSLSAGRSGLQLLDNLRQACPFFVNATALL